MPAETSEEAVIQVSDVSKDFLLPHQRKQSVKSMITGTFRHNSGRAEVQHTLHNISLDIQKGEFFGILGRNGSGKSTLLKILAGIYAPTNGEVKTFGKLVPFIELGVGFNPELTGRENVYLNGAMLGFSKKQIDGMYDGIVAFAELEKFMDQKLKNYSSGMQVRLAFSMATRSEADILLVDEVLAVGDADFQRKCYDYFKSLKKNNKTVVFVTHDMSAVREYCERAVLIQDGVIAFEGTGDNAAEEYLKLFNKDSVVNNTRSGGRWGNGQVTIKNLDVAIRGHELRLTAELKASAKGAEEVVFGYRFLNSEDKLIMGGNSLNARNGKKFSLKANETTRLVFTLPDILGSGTVNVGATVRLSDGVTTCDSWENAVTFSTTKAESYYPVIAPASMEIV